MDVQLTVTLDIDPEAWEAFSPLSLPRTTPQQPLSEDVAEWLVEAVGTTRAYALGAVTVKRVAVLRGFKS